MKELEIAMFVIEEETENIFTTVERSQKYLGSSRAK